MTILQTVTFKYVCLLEKCNYQSARIKVVEKVLPIDTSAPPPHLGLEVNHPGVEAFLEFDCHGFSVIALEVNP